MAYQEKETRGYGTRLGSSIKGIGGGIALLVIGTVLLWWNEGQAVKTEKMLDEAQEVAISVDDVSKVDPDYDGMLIHATADATTTDSLSDPMFDVGAVAIRLNRNVEYYQWVENVSEQKKDKIGGSEEITRIYTYKKAWVNRPIASSEFKDSAYRYSNKVLMQLDNEEIVAENVSFGAYRLPDFLISSISGKKPLNINIPVSQIQQLNNVIIPVATCKSVEMYQLARMKEMKDLENKLISEARQAMDSIAADSVGKAYANQATAQDLENEFVHQHDNILYLGRAEGTPEIGDVRVTFTYVLPGKASLIAKTKGDTFVSYVAKNGKKFSTLSMGEQSLEEMMQSQHESNNMWLWILRFLGILIVIGGFKAIFAPLPALLNVLPFLASIAQVGVSLVANILGIAWSLIIIGIAWIFYRPVLGIILFVISAAGIFFIIKRSREKKTIQAAESAQVTTA